jgi:endonuclease/exonuclease/phosphatase family metal-dependent hydrolase
LYLNNLAPLLNRLLTLTYAIIVVFTVLVFLSPNIPPADFWMSAFLPYSIPFLILIHLLVAIYFYLAKKWLGAIFSTLLLGIGLSFVPNIFALNLHRINKLEKADFSILSYNVRVFNVYQIYNHNNPELSKSLLRETNSLKGDIKCFQEFYSDETDKTYSSIKKLSVTHPYYYFEPFHANKTGGSFGMAIFSKYPIEKKGSIHFKEKSNNQIIYADIAIGRNIIRVFNVHLQSMHIDDEQLVNAADEQHFKQYLLKALLNYRRGAISRSKQVDRLIHEINRSPYPVFVCGDLNEPPLSYAYKQLSKTLYNSQEEAGRGFGVTHNGKIPLLRIDNQFYQKDIQIHSFQVLTDKKRSDHFPLLGYYSFK